MRNRQGISDVPDGVLGLTSMYVMMFLHVSAGGHVSAGVACDDVCRCWLVCNDVSAGGHVSAGVDLHVMMFLQVLTCM